MNIKDTDNPSVCEGIDKHISVKDLARPLALVWLFIFFVISSYAGQLADSVSGRDSVNGREKLIVSLITCYPGSEVYELCGHSALRIRSASKDSVWNYGVFDFNTPNFIYRFVKGECDYLLAGYPFDWFMPEYVRRGSKVVEQELDLTQDEAYRLQARLQLEGLPQNRQYRYNYVKDNCATRITERLEETLDEKLSIPDSVMYGTFRNEMRAYHKNYPWYQLGIDIALGSGIDYDLAPSEEMFVPVEMMRKWRYAEIGDGRKLVGPERVLYEGVPDPTEGPTPWMLTPITVFCALFVIAAGISVAEWKKRKIYRVVYAIWFGVLGLAGCVVTFLVFCSSHEATSPNLLIVWLNPLQLLMALLVWGRRTRKIGIAIAVYNIAVNTGLLVAWPLQSQSTNPALFPAIGATLALSVAYFAVIWNEKRESVWSFSAGKTSEKNNKQKK